MNHLLPPSIRYGLILAVLSAAIGTVLLVVKMNFLLMGIMSLVLIVGIMILWVVFAIRVRKSNGNAFTYQQAFMVLVVIGFTSMLLSQLWNTVYLHFIDPNVMSRMAEHAADSMVDMGLSPDSAEVEEALRQIEEDGKMTTQWRKFGWSAITMIIISLLVALIIKRKPDGMTSNEIA